MKMFLFLFLFLILAVSASAEVSHKAVSYCEPRLHPRPGFYMLDAMGKKYVPSKVYMSQILGLNATSEPDYKALAEPTPTEEGFSKLSLYVMPLLDENDVCDCAGTLYLAKLIHYYQPNGEQYRQLPERNKELLHAVVFLKKQIVLNALIESENMLTGKATLCQ